MNILHIDCSSRPASYSRRLSAAITAQLQDGPGPTTVIRRDLGLHPIPHTATDYAESLSSPAAAGAASAGAHRLSEELITELEAADIIVIGTPMHNFTIPSVLKAWIDQVLRVGRTIIPTSTGKVGALADRPVFVAIASGGVFEGEGANQPDLLTPYLTSALGCIGLQSIRFTALQATAFKDETCLADEILQSERVNWLA
ncbi:MAG: FMN-dependent NADH-azoreductase [Sphingobium sp.]